MNRTLLEVVFKKYLKLKLFVCHAIGNMKCILLKYTIEKDGLVTDVYQGDMVNVERLTSRESNNRRYI